MSYRARMARAVACVLSIKVVRTVLFSVEALLRELRREQMDFEASLREIESLRPAAALVASGLEATTTDLHTPDLDKDKPAPNSRHGSRTALLLRVHGHPRPPVRNVIMILVWFRWSGNSLGV